jgi:hypothetical protein
MMKVEERDDVVIMNGLEISGFVDKAKRCTTCQNHVIYDDTFDAYFCASCNDWKEEKCSDSIATTVYKDQSVHCQANRY